MSTDLLDDNSFNALMRRMGAAPPAVARPDGVPSDVVTTKHGLVYHTPACPKLLRSRTAKIRSYSHLPPVWWSRQNTEAQAYDPHGQWAINGRVPCRYCLPDLQPKGPCETALCSYCLVDRRQQAFRGCVASATGRKYHRPGCSSFPHYASIKEITTLHVVRKHPQTGEPEDVILEPCKICSPRIVTEPAPNNPNPTGE